MKNKGFTLIELLAVIVILAIIALIAVPIVLNIIKDSKENSTIRSAEMYMDAVELAVTNEMMDPSFPQGEVTCEMIANPPSVRFPEDYDSTKYDNDDLLCYQEGSDTGNPVVVDISGDVPTEGTIVFSNGKINPTGTSLAMSDGNTYAYTNGSLAVSNSSSQVFKPQYYTWKSQGYTGQSLPEDAVTDPTNLTTNPGSNVYMGLDVEDDIVTNAYVCFVKNSTEYCLKGNDSSSYVTNQEILDAAFPNACSLEEIQEYAYTFSYYSCSIDGMSAYIDPDGYVDVTTTTVSNPYTQVGCYVSSPGSYWTSTSKNGI